MAETLFTWGNPTAVRNQLRIGEGEPERGQIGIADRSEGFLLYNSKGDPLPAFGGLGLRDKGYVGTSRKDQDEFGINIALIQDPVLQGLLNIFRREYKDPLRTVHRAAQVYFDNIESVNKTVMKELGPEIKKKFLDSLLPFIGFLAGHGLSTWLMRATNLVTISIGLALKAFLVGAGYIFDIDFAGSAMERLSEAANHISRIQQVEGQEKLTHLSQHHLEEGAKPIRSMIAEIAMMATMKGLTKGFNKLLAVLTRKGSATIECTGCKVKEEKGEQGKEKEKGGTGQERSTGLPPATTPEGRELSEHALESTPRHKMMPKQADDVIDHYSRKTKQEDGAVVYIKKEPGRGRSYSIVIVGEKIVTGLTNLSPKELADLGKNNGFDPNP